jgi:hypothetical protein
VLRRLLALLYLLALYLRTRLFDARLRLRLPSRLRPLDPNARLRSDPGLWLRLRRCAALFLLHSLRSFNTHRRWRRAALLLLHSLRPSNTHRRWRRSTRFRLHARCLWPHHFPFRLSSRRRCYSLSLRLLSLTLRLLGLDLLFFLLLLKLLHLPARISVSARCLGSKLGHLLFTRGIVSRRNRATRNLIPSLICSGPALISQVELLVLDSIRQLLNAQSLCQIPSERRRRCPVNKHRIIKFLGDSRRQIYLAAAPG